MKASNPPAKPRPPSAASPDAHVWPLSWLFAALLLASLIAYWPALIDKRVVTTSVEVVS